MVQDSIFQLLKKFIIPIISGIVLIFLFFTVLFMSMVAVVVSNKNNGHSYYNTNFEASGCPEEYFEYYSEASLKTNIPVYVLLAVTKQESNFDYTAEGGGAYGLMQIQRSESSGYDLWKGMLNEGLREFINNDYGYSEDDPEELWQEYLNNPELQIFVGAFYLRYYANYVLYKIDYVDSLKYTSSENMNLIDWYAETDDNVFQTILKRIFACYNGGPDYGMKVDFDKAQNNYPNQVFIYAMAYRGEGTDYDKSEYTDENIENAIEVGMDLVNVGTYLWGGGRTQEDVDNNVFDCSSFVYHCYEEAGISLGDRGSVTTYSLVQMGRAVHRLDMRRGDLIFFDTDGANSHVAIYLGNNRFLHDSTSKGVIVSELTGYYAQAFNGNVRRIVTTSYDIEDDKEA